MRRHFMGWAGALALPGHLRECATHVIHAASLEPVGRFGGDIAWPVVAQQAGRYRRSTVL